METHEPAKGAAPSQYKQDLQELVELASQPDSDPQKLKSFLRVQEIIAAYRPELAEIFQGLFQEREGEEAKKRQERFVQNAQTSLGRVREHLPPRTDPAAETSAEQEQRLNAYRLCDAVSRVPGFAVFSMLRDEYAFPKNEKPVTERVIREMQVTSPTPMGGRAPMCCPNIGGLPD